MIAIVWKLTVRNYFTAKSSFVNIVCIFALCTEYKKMDAEMDTDTNCTAMQGLHIRNGKNTHKLPLCIN